MKDIAGASKKTRLLVQENIRKAEIEKRFNDDVQGVDWEGMQKVTEDFVFLPKNPFLRLYAFVVRILAMLLAKPLCFFGIGTAKIHGRENFKGIKAAVVTCNHVHIFDSFFVRAAAFGHKLYITVAEFNNMKGFLGGFLRAAGCIPFSDCFTAMKNLSKTTEKLLKTNHYVLFYPEKAMWPRYVKPRPYIEGAFHTAVINNVPVIPTFIAFKAKKNGAPDAKRKGELYVLKPIYPKPELSRKENVAYLKQTAFNEVCECYKEVFGEEPYSEAPFSINI